jgi:hypothetical protein
MSATGQEPAPDAPAPSAPEAPASEAPTTAPAQPDGLDRVYSRMEEMASQQQALIESFQQFAAPPEEEPELYDDEGELTEEGAEALIADLVAKQVETHLAPREAARLVEQRDDAFEALRAEYPELQDDKISREVLAEAIGWANRVDPKIVDRPEFVDVIESFYKARKFEELREREQAEQPRPVILESAAGGGRQQRSSNEPDWQKRVIAAAEKDGPRI